MQRYFDWEKDWEEKTLGTVGQNSSAYWNKRAEDYSDYIETSDYEHGRKIRQLFAEEGILQADFTVLDIAAGPGSVTIPLAEAVKKVTAVEPAAEMIRHLTHNAATRQIHNIETVNSTWQEIDAEAWEGKFDLVTCSHALWHFPDIGEQLMRLNRVSKGYCCLANGVGGDGHAEMYRKLGIEQKSIDYFLSLLNILYGRGILANVTMIDLEMRRSL
jgi:ubiquinone/menaquinone biosynthesis C-methylase UbiE